MRPSTVHSPGWAQRAADRARDASSAPSPAPSGQRRRAAQVLGRAAQRLLRRDARQDHAELLAAPAPDGVVRPDRPAQPARDVDQHRVAGRVAVRVVDRLEAVEVEQHHARGSSLAGRPAELGVQRVDQVPPVREAGHRVGARLALHLGAVLDIAGHVAADVEHQVVLGVVRPGPREPARAAVLRDAAERDGRRAVGREVGVDLRVVVHRVVRMHEQRPLAADHLVRLVAEQRAGPPG